MRRYAATVWVTLSLASVGYGGPGAAEPANVSRSPTKASDTEHRQRVATTRVAAYATGVGEPVTVLTDDFEQPSGWTVGDPLDPDDAKNGIWTRVDPVGTQVKPGGAQVQPEDDVTRGPGTMCYVTGQGRVGGQAGMSDIDDGKTTLISPAFDLAACEAPTIGYWRWFSNDEGFNPNTEVLIVQVSDDDGANWTTVETVGPTGPEASGGWFYHEFAVEEFVSAGSQVRLRFIAEDCPHNGPSLVEAAVDDLTITALNCTQAGDGDIDQDGDRDLADFRWWQRCWQQPSIMPPCSNADIDGNGSIDLNDYAGFQAEFTGPN